MPSINNAIQVSAGNSHSLVLTNQGQVFSCGNNADGQLGLNDLTQRRNPTLISNLTDVVAISTGYAFSLALTKQGNVYSFGSNTVSFLFFKLAWTTWIE